MLEIRSATDDDFEAIHSIFQAIITPGDTFAFPAALRKEEIYALWMGKDFYPYVATEEGTVIGAYTFHPNQPGRGSHVANAAYMVKPDCQSKGAGRKMGEHSLRETKSKGFQAMQFNIVVSTNLPAVRLWKSLGFQIIGTVPKAFNHATLGLVDTYIMHQFL